jgi:hypothetical protein
MYNRDNKMLVHTIYDFFYLFDIRVGSTFSGDQISSSILISQNHNHSFIEKGGHRDRTTFDANYRQNP